MNGLEIREIFQNLRLSLSDIAEQNIDSLFPGVAKWEVFIEVLDSNFAVEGLIANPLVSAVTVPFSVPIEYRQGGTPNKLEVWNVRLVSGVTLILSTKVEPKPLTPGELDIRAMLRVVSDHAFVPFVEELAVETSRFEATQRLREGVKSFTSAIESLLDGVKQSRAAYIYRERLECTALGWSRTASEEHAVYL